MKKNYLKNNKLNGGFTRTPKLGVTPKGGGFTLVETLVAISIFTMSIMALLSVLASGIANTSYAKQKMVATYLAQEGIESVRNMRDTYVLYDSKPPEGWNNFKSEFSSCNQGEGKGCGINNSVSVTSNNFIFKCSNDAKCNLYLDNGNYSSVGVDESGFIREVWMDANGDQAKIYSTVYWTQGSGNHNVSFSENLYNWTQ